MYELVRVTEGKKQIVGVKIRGNLMKLFSQSHIYSKDGHEKTRFDEFVSLSYFHTEKFENEFKFL